VTTRPHVVFSRGIVMATAAGVICAPYAVLFLAAPETEGEEPSTSITTEGVSLPSEPPPSAPALRLVRPEAA